MLERFKRRLAERTDCCSNLTYSTIYVRRRTRRGRQSEAECHAQLPLRYQLRTRTCKQRVRSCSAIGDCDPHVAPCPTARATQPLRTAHTPHCRPRSSAVHRAVATWPSAIPAKPSCMCIFATCASLRTLRPPPRPVPLPPPVLRFHPTSPPALISPLVHRHSPLSNPPVPVPITPCPPDRAASCARFVDTRPRKPPQLVA